MTQEEKELVLKDLCGRQPYSLKCCDFCYNDDGDIVNTIETLECIYPSTMEYKYKDVDAKHDIKRIKPYLRPLSSMTKKEKNECINLINIISSPSSESDKISKIIDCLNENIRLMDWLNAHHFDYRDLINKGLALEAPENMYTL